MTYISDTHSSNYLILWQHKEHIRHIQATKYTLQGISLTSWQKKTRQRKVQRIVGHRSDSGAAVRNEVADGVKKCRTLNIYLIRTSQNLMFITFSITQGVISSDSTFCIPAMIFLRKNIFRFQCSYCWRYFSLYFALLPEIISF